MLGIQTTPTRCAVINARQDGKCADGDINQALATKASIAKQNTGRLPEVSRLPCLCNKTDHLHTKPPPAQTAA